jgi:DNA-binding NtrC family response regulator
MKTANILIVDNDREICRSLEMLFSREGYWVASASTGQHALALISEKNFDVIYTDLALPDMSGFEILAQSRKLHHPAQVIVITETPTIETAVEAIKLGAHDYIRKPLLPDKMVVITKRAIETVALAAEVQRLRLEVSRRYGIGNIIGESQKMMEIFKTIRQTGGSDSNVLITGESGTGKELVARAIHYNSQRRNNRFVPVNCAAISRDLIEAEFFGYVKGAFSGAIRDKKGFLDIASGGTLLLDEIGETTQGFQAKLLRAIQEGEYNKVGDPYPTSADVRVVAASNRDLQKAITEGLFREDLFYRLNVISIHIPPLRERTEDIPFLAQHFLEKYSKKRKDHKVTEISSAALELLMGYDYPGNVRELENAVDYGVTFAHGDKITVNDLPSSIKQMRATSHQRFHLKPLKSARLEFERNLIVAALKECQGNISRAAHLLDIQRQNLQQRIKALGISAAGFKSQRKHRSATSA